MVVQGLFCMKKNRVKKVQGGGRSDDSFSLCALSWEPYTLSPFTALRQVAIVGVSWYLCYHKSVLAFSFTHLLQTN